MNATTSPPDEVPAPSKPSDPMLFEISIDAVPPKKFRVGEDVYELFSFEHLSPEQEAAVTATFSRFERTYDDLARAKNDDVAQRVAAKLRVHRERLIGLMTSLPEEVYKGLNAAKQGKILRSIQDEIGAEAEDEDADVGDEI